MASLPPSLRDTLTYFDKYDYPLILDEIKYWSSVTHPRPSLYQREGNKRGEFYFLPGRSHLVKLRNQRERFSKEKWLIAKRVGDQLKKFPFIAAVFVTGALAMKNCPANDDIDIMIITYPNALWITRFFVNLFLSSIRRYPGETKAPNKICPNLWLDTNHLQIAPHDIYRAHEILQAKVLWDRTGIHNQFLTQNSWVKKYLPVAYKYLTSLHPPLLNSGEGIGVRLLWPLNFVFFVLQYLYMFPKMTSERVGLGFAFFHPAKSIPS